MGETPAPGERLKVFIADYNQDDHKIIFSQKNSLSVEDFEKISKELKKGERVKVTITNGTNFGYFVSFPVKIEKKSIDLEGLIHISELSWGKVDDISELYQSGDEVEAVVLGFDRDSRRVDFSLKRLSKDPFEEIKEKYPLEKKIEGVIARIEDGNIYLTLEEGLEGLIKKEKISPTANYSVGSTISATVTNHDSRRRRIELVPVLLEKPLMYR